VIPKWISALLKRELVRINGDGETSRDFCFVENVVQANLLAATTANPRAVNEVYNIAVGQRTTLNELFTHLQNALRKNDSSLPEQKPVYQDFRAGDVRHSLANIDKARQLLGYEPEFDLSRGLATALDWYAANLV
jgi:UDP-N-acetylglucosamine 4-epimerase